jgi:hypothetical protein
MDATLKHSCWDLEVVIDVGEGRRDDVLCRRRRLEQRHMEHWVDGGRRRQLQLVGGGTDPLDHLERPEVAE